MGPQLFFRILDDANYQQWISTYEELTLSETGRLQTAVNSAAFQPVIGVVPLAREYIARKALDDFSQMLGGQLYEKWQIFSSQTATEAISKAVGITDFVLPLPLDAVLEPSALARFVLALNEVADADILFADEDFLYNGKRTRPLFKTDWDPYFILGKDCVGVPALYRSKVLRTEPLSVEITGVDNFLYALTLQSSAATSGDKIIHIPCVLCHRTARSDWNRAQAAETALKHLSARGEEIEKIEPSPLASLFNRVHFAVHSPAPMVSVIVPTKDRAELIGPCIEGILERTNYPSLELIIVDNGTTADDAMQILDRAKQNTKVRILRDDRGFNFSRLNNQAAQIARGDILLLLNNDTKIIQADWLAEMVSLAVRPDIGIVGARLLYPDLRVQHAGVCFGNIPELYHGMRLADRDEAGPAGDLALLRCAWAVTGACVALRKSLYLDVGGLDERLAVAYNDIDLCRKIAAKGLAILCTPFAELLHFESISRGFALSPAEAERDATELMAFWSKHPALYERHDPFFNPQLDQGEGYVDFARPPRLSRFHAEFNYQVPKVQTY